MGGGEGQVLSALKNGVSAFQWSPDSKRLVAVGRSGPSDEVAPATRKSDTRHYKNISYKFNDTGWYDDKRNHLWIVDAATGKDKQITSGERGTMPIRNGHRTERGSLLCRTARGVSMTASSIKTRG